MLSFNETSESDRAVELGLELSVLRPAAVSDRESHASDDSLGDGASKEAIGTGSSCSPELSALRRIFNNESKLISSHISLLLFDSMR